MLESIKNTQVVFTIVCSRALNDRFVLFDRCLANTPGWMKIRALDSYAQRSILEETSRERPRSAPRSRFKKRERAKNFENASSETLWKCLSNSQSENISEGIPKRLENRFHPNSKHRKTNIWKTSQERLKSGLYLSLKNSKRTSKYQVFSSTVPECGNNFSEFFSKFFWSLW